MAIKLVVEIGTINSGIEAAAEIAEIATGKDVSVQKAYEHYDFLPKTMVSDGFGFKRTHSGIEVTINDKAVTSFIKWCRRWIPALAIQAKLLKGMFKPFFKMMKRSDHMFNGMMKDLDKNMLVDGKTVEEWEKEHDAILITSLIPEVFKKVPPKNKKAKTGKDEDVKKVKPEPEEISMEDLEKECEQ